MLMLTVFQSVSSYFPDLLTNSIMFTVYVCSCVHDQCEIITALVFGFAVWVMYVLARRYSLKFLLMNHSWMYEPFGRISLLNKIWFGLVKVVQGRDPLLYGYQSALPKLPVPSLQGTKSRVSWLLHFPSVLADLSNHVLYHWNFVTDCISCNLCNPYFCRLHIATIKQNF